MHDNARMSDTDVLLAIGDTLSRVPASAPPPLRAIKTRGRDRRRHRQSGLAAIAAAGVAAGTGLVLGLTGVVGSAPAHSTGVIRTAAFTLISHANGTVTLTIDPKVLFDPSTLQSDLAQDNIPAIVTVGSFCSSDPAPAGFSQVVAIPIQPQQQPDSNASVTIDPSAIPAGAEISFGIFEVGNGEQTSVALIDTGSYTCTSTPPTTLPPGGGALLRYGGGAS